MSKVFKDTRRKGTDAEIVRAIDATESSWRFLADRTHYNSLVRNASRGENGVYAIRDKGTHETLYVGESHTGRLWKTLLRHFQGQRSFEGIGEWTHPDPTKVEVKTWTTRTGDDALDLELIMISRLAPPQVRGTRDRKLAELVDAQDLDDGDDFADQF